MRCHSRHGTTDNDDQSIEETAHFLEIGQEHDKLQIVATLVLFLPQYPAIYYQHNRSMI